MMNNARWIITLVAMACGGPSMTPRPAPHTAAPPPRPGSSITHTKLCECRTCEPTRCCQGETETAKSKACGDSYDFSREGCGLAVASCTGRCGRHVWRVALSESCEPRPETCC